jgi:chromosome transmission fidelity protein 18
LKNFLGIGAQKAKASRNARKKALVGFNNRIRAEKLTHTGSGIPLTQVVRFKYQKGFTQAVRTVCQMEDLL